MNSNKKTANITDTSPRQAAIIAGIGYLISFVGVIFADIMGGNLVVAGDAAITAQNIMANDGPFRASIVGWFIAILGDMLRAWALYVFFRQVNKSLALLSAWFMLVHDAIFGSALLNLVFASELLSGAGLSIVFEPNQMHSLMTLFINGYNYGFQIGIFFFSFHLGIIGYLVLKSGYVPKMLGILLIVAFLGYLITSLDIILLLNYPKIINQVLMVPNFISELSLIVWLVLKGGKGVTVK